jgi:hypothetical protein
MALTELLTDIGETAEENSEHTNTEQSILRYWETVHRMQKAGVEIVTLNSTAELLT